MNTTEYCVQLALVLIVVRHIKGGKLDAASLVLPVILIAATAVYYLRQFPTGGGDLGLELGLCALGVLSGVLCGITTRVWNTKEGVFCKAGFVPAAFWIGGIGARIVFVLATEHTSFNKTVETFSRTHQITGSQAWVVAFVLMAMGEAVARLVTIRVRARGVRRAGLVGLAA